MVIHAVFNHLGCDNRPIGKSGAGCFQVEGSGIDGSQIGLDDAGRARQCLIGRQRAYDDQIDIFRADFGHFHSFFSRSRCQIGRIDALWGYVSGSDACTAADPFIRCIQKRF